MKDGIFNGVRTLSVMPTNACPAACLHCGSESHPHSKENISTNVINEAIDQTAKHSFYNIVFTGGEPTLRWNDLLGYISRAHKHGMGTRVVTNAHWARTREVARIKLKQLYETGLDEINFSTGDEHARFIPISNVANAAVEAVTMNFQTIHIMVELRASAQITKDLLIFEIKKSGISEEDFKRISILASPWMPLNGNEKGKYDDSTTLINKSNVSAKRGCNSILQTYTLQANKTVTACCGIGARVIPDLAVSNYSDEVDLASSIQNSEDDLIKIMLRYMGPEQILAWVGDKNPAVKWENMYAHKCQACHRIYSDKEVQSTIENFVDDILPELMQIAWLEEEYIPKNYMQ
jgi:organic radical activating enzyme